tara:strand:+ start:550 stop:1398 length:849 start_codon:yes stop_codon:yes gene_type:complete
MANGYNPMQFVTGLSGIAQQMGGQGLRWMGQQKGLGRRAINNYLKMMANAATTASSELGIGNLLAKGAGLVATAYGGPILGGLVAGGVSKGTGDIAVSGLSSQAAGLDMDSILYGRDKADQAVTSATGAIDKLINSVDSQAISQAITTPLLYMTLQNTFESFPEAGTAGKGGTPPLETPKVPVTDVSVSEALSKSTPVEFGFSDAVNPTQTNPGLILSELSRMGSIPSASNVASRSSNPFKSLMSLLGSKNQFTNDLSTDTLEEELKFNPYGGNYNNPGGIY